MSNKLFIFRGSLDCCPFEFAIVSDTEWGARNILLGALEGRTQYHENSGNYASSVSEVLKSDDLLYTPLNNPTKLAHGSFREFVMNSVVHREPVVRVFFSSFLDAMY